MTHATGHVDDAIRKQLWLLATAVGDQCFTAALTAYEDARTDGLCHAGAWECALQAMQHVDFASLVARTLTAP